MVYTNNDLKQKSKQQSTTKDSVAVYPFTVDVASFPERKYLAGIYKFAKFSYISLLISVVLCFLIIFRSFSRSTSPTFIYWDDLSNKFSFKPYEYAKKGDSFTKTKTEHDYYTEYFINTYLNKRFGVSDIFVENNQNWCDCEKTRPNKMGIFDLNQNCYLCTFSAGLVYKNFLNNEKTAYEKFADNGITRRVEIINLEKQYSRADSSKVSFLTNIFNSFTSSKPKIYKTYDGYKVDFIIEDIKDGQVTGAEVLTGYLEVTGNQSSPTIKYISSENYLFHPNYDKVLKKHFSQTTNEVANAIYK